MSSGIAHKPYPNIFEIPFNFKSTLIIASTPQVMQVFRGSVFRTVPDR
jgi:hypothetical protein